MWSSIKAKKEEDITRRSRPIDRWFPPIKVKLPFSPSVCFYPDRSAGLSCLVKLTGNQSLFTVNWALCFFKYYYYKLSDVAELRETWNKSGTSICARIISGVFGCSLIFRVVKHVRSLYSNVQKSIVCPNYHSYYSYI